MKRKQGVSLTPAEACADVMAALMWSPRTFSELKEIVGSCHHTLINILRKYKQSGVVRIVGHRDDTGGAPARIYGLQSKPHELPDETHVYTPKPRRRAKKHAEDCRLDNHSSKTRADAHPSIKLGAVVHGWNQEY